MDVLNDYRPLIVRFYRPLIVRLVIIVHYHLFVRFYRPFCVRHFTSVYSQCRAGWSVGDVIIWVCTEFRVTDIKQIRDGTASPFSKVKQAKRPNLVVPALMLVQWFQSPQEESLF